MRRQKLNRHTSKRIFTNAAVTTHKKNIQAAPMRGGIRL